MTITVASMSRLSERDAVAFDRIAEEYDQVFTHSIIGRAQRTLVHETLRDHFRSGQHILELNCGTGEDAIHLASRGVSVTACDVSARMIDVSRQKLLRSDSDLPITFAICANEHLDSLRDYELFDGALSNFGGLNCTADLAGVARTMAEIIRPGGEVFLCLISRFCAWEVLWYSAHGLWSKAFRRLKAGGTEARIGDATMRVYYPTVREVRKAFAPAFRLSSRQGIGVALPPSWMEPVLQDYPAFVDRLTQLDRWLGHIPVFRGMADHTLYRFVREGR